MNKYQIRVPNIHSEPCITLIKTSLQYDFVDIEIDMDTQIVKFSSELDRDEVEEILEKIFETLRESDYDYEDLRLLDED
jgi:hypothetical protein